MCIRDRYNGMLPEGRRPRNRSCRDRRSADSAARTAAPYAPSRRKPMRRRADDTGRAHYRRSLPTCGRACPRSGRPRTSRTGYGGVPAVSYTHLDVYKRQGESPKVAQTYRRACRRQHETNSAGEAASLFLFHVLCFTPLHTISFRLSETTAIMK